MAGKLRHRSRRLGWIAAILGTILLVLILAVQLVEQPLRRYIEKKLNLALPGYTLSLGDLELHLLRLAITLKQLTIIQQANPQPVMASIPSLHAGVQWAEILKGSLGTEAEIFRPRIRASIQQLRSALKRKEPVKERQWRDIAKIMRASRINRVAVEDGSITYFDENPDEPLVVDQLRIAVSDIGRSDATGSGYPTSFRVEANVFGPGRGMVEGSADLLGETQPLLGARLKFEKVPLGKLKPAAAHFDLDLRGGSLAADGELRYDTQLKMAHFTEINIDDLDVDYIYDGSKPPHTPPPPHPKAGESALRIRLDRLQAKNGTLGFVNKSADPSYRLFLADTNLTISHLDTDFAQGGTELTLAGRFMASGTTEAVAVFRAVGRQRDFALAIRIVNVELARLNNLLKAHGDLDVAAGRFALFSEAQVKEDRISGYVKPLISDVEVYSTSQEKEESLLQKLYEGTLGTLAEIFEGPGERVATKTDISGTVDNPDASILEILGNLVRNAFYKAILPGFEQEAAEK